jgi:hypothetical protein
VNFQPEDFAMGNAVKFGVAVAAVLVGIWLSAVIPNPVGMLTKKA